MASKRSRRGNRRCSRCGQPAHTNQLITVGAYCFFPLSREEEMERGWREARREVGLEIHQSCGRQMIVEAALKYEHGDSKVNTAWAPSSVHRFKMYHPLRGDKITLDCADIIRNMRRWTQLFDAES